MEVPMPTVRRFAVPFALLFVAASPAFAGQQHLVDPGQLAATLEQHVSAQDADRSAVRQALARPEVREAAARIGLDLAKATAAVETMDAADLARAADAARQVNHQLSGGASSITITTTTLIIILLVVILLIVAIK
jgi:hypothetical protein